jgi:DnaJ like chaperone protein
MNPLGLTSVDVFVIVVGLVFGYLLVAHVLERKGSADASQRLHRPAADVPPPHWENVLGVSRYASPEQVQQAWREQMAKYHPDKVAALGDELKALADRKSKEINAAYAAACRDKGMG